MLDNERIEERLRKQKRRRKVIVVLEILVILLLFAGILYYMLAVRPALEAGHLERAVPSFLQPYLPQTAAAPEPTPTRLPTPTPTPTAIPEPTPTATPTPEPTPTLAPEIEALNLPSFAVSDPKDWNLILVNQDHPIPDGYTFTLVYVDEEETFCVDARCAEALQAMLRDCRKAGYTPEICSAYRDSDTQTYLYEEELAEETGEEADGYWDADTGAWIPPASEEPPEQEDDSAAVAAPGTSEHELGLAVDLFSSENTALDASQEDTETQQWLMQHCSDYGFILRYPNEKSDITGIIYEPWHYRYVGVDAAKDMQQTGLCLEEYLDHMRQVKEAEAALQGTASASSSTE